MKFLNYTFVVLSLLLFTNLTQAQEVLLKNKQAISGFISIESILSDFDDRLVYSQGANAAFLLNQRFYIGGYSEAMLSSINGGFAQNFDCYEPDYASAGLMIGRIIQPEKLVHFDLRVKMGLGGFRIGDDSALVIADEHFESDYEAVFVAHPSAGIEVNITKFFKLNTHLGYRYVGGIDDPVMDSDVLNGFTGQLGLVFGWFGGKKKNKELDEKLMSL